MKAAIPQSKSFFQSRALSLQFCEGWEQGRCRRNQHSWLMEFKKRSHLHSFKCEVKQDVKAVGSNPKSCLKSLMVRTLTSTFSDSCWRKPSRTWTAGVEKTTSACKQRPTSCQVLMQLVTPVESNAHSPFRKSLVLQNDTGFTLPVFCKWTHKAWVRAHLFTTWITEYFKSTVQITARKIKDAFQHIPAH